MNREDWYEVAWVLGPFVLIPAGALLLALLLPGGAA